MNVQYLTIEVRKASVGIMVMKGKRILERFHPERILQMRRSEEEKEEKVMKVEARDRRDENVTINTWDISTRAYYKEEEEELEY